MLEKRKRKRKKNSGVGKLPRAVKAKSPDKAAKAARTLTLKSRVRTLGPSTLGQPEAYAFEKLSEAVHELVTGAGRVQERLGMAMTYLVPVRPEEIPDSELRLILLAIKRDLTREEPEGKEGRLAATLRTLADEEASAIARCILDLYVELVERT